MTKPSVIIQYDEYQRLLLKEREFDVLLAKYPELREDTGPTRTAKKYKNALSDLLKRVEEVLGSEEFVGIFALAEVHGVKYKGPTLAEDIKKAKKLLGQ